MDSLDPRTLFKLYQYVKKNSAVKRKKPAPKKVKVQYSEEDATKKITELERTLQKFEQPSAAPRQKSMCGYHHTLVMLTRLPIGHAPCVCRP